MSNYPPGAENDPRAPWNEKNQPLVDVNVAISCTLSKSTTIKTDDYIAEEWSDTSNEDGERYTIGGTDYDFSESDLKSAYEESEWTILEMLTELGNFVRKELEKGVNKSMESYYKTLLKSTEGWAEDECEVIED